MAKSKEKQIINENENTPELKEAADTSKVSEVSVDAKTEELEVENNKIEVVFTSNVNHCGVRYKKGESLEVSKKDYSVLLKAGVIDAE